MTCVVWKFNVPEPLEGGWVDICLPIGAHVTSFEVETEYVIDPVVLNYDVAHEIVCYALCDVNKAREFEDSGNMRVQTFLLVNTGQKFELPALLGNFISTLRCGKVVWHAFRCSS